MNEYNNPNFSIALYIGGNVERGTGFGQIVSVGALAGEEYKKLDASPISRGSTSENPVFTLKNTQDYVLYKIWDDSVIISDDSNRGRLCIGMTIPSMARLKNNRSPYSLLMDIYKKFLAEGTEDIGDGRRRFVKKEIDKEVFKEIIMSYPIEPAVNNVEAMTGKTRGQIRIRQDQMEAFFRDSQYHQFVDYDSIEITTQGDNMFNIEIPRPKCYQIIVNGRPTNQFLQKGNVEDLVVKLDSTEDVKYESLRISLEQLSKNDKTQRTLSGKTTARLDEENLCVVCTLNPIEKWYYKKIKYDTLNSDERALNYIKENLGKRIKILVNGHVWEEKEIKPSRIVSIGEGGRVVVDKDVISIQPDRTDDYRFSIVNAKIESDYPSSDKENLVLLIKAEKVRRDTVNTSGNSSKSGLDFKSLLIGAAIGLAIGIGGALIFGYFRGAKSEKVKKEQEKAEQKRLEDIKSKERKAYDNACKQPVRNKNISEIDKQASEYLTLLQQGAVLYREYLRDYPKDSDGHNEDHYNDISSRLNEFIEDSSKYAKNLEEFKKAEEDAYNKCVNAKGYDNIIAACAEYESSYQNGKHISDVKNRHGEANDKKADADAKKKAEDKLIADVEKRGLELLNQGDINKFREWLKEKPGSDRTNKEILNNIKGSRSNAVEWILDYNKKEYNNKKLNNAQRKNIKDYLKNNWMTADKKFNFKNWNEVNLAYDKIVNILDENN